MPSAFYWPLLVPCAPAGLRRQLTNSLGVIRCTPRYYADGCPTHYRYKVEVVKKEIKFFVSYAHKNSKLVNDFLDRLTDVLTPSRLYDYSLWKDSALVVGENWNSQILEARETCDIGLLLISPAFLSSKFICKAELPHFVGSARAHSFPVMLWPVDFVRHDLSRLRKYPTGAASLLTQGLVFR